MSTVSKNVGVFSPNRRQCVDTGIFSDATDAVIENSLTVTSGNAETKIAFAQDTDLNNIPEITLKSDIKRVYEDVETLQDTAVISPAAEQGVSFTNDADNYYTKTVYERDGSGIRQQKVEYSVNEGSKEAGMTKGFNISDEAMLIYTDDGTGEKSFGLMRSTIDDSASLVGTITYNTPDGTVNSELANVEYVKQNSIGKTGSQTLNGDLVVENSTSGSDIAVSPSNGGFPSTIFITDGQYKTFSVSPGVITSIFQADGSTYRNRLTYAINSVSNEGELKIDVLNNNSVIGSLLLAPNNITLGTTAGTSVSLALDQSGKLSVNAPITGVTPTDTTDKKQLVTIEYLESVLNA